MCRRALCRWASRPSCCSSILVQVLKFAPHFDTLLAARYIFDRTTLTFDAFGIRGGTYTKLDKESHVYSIFSISPLLEYEDRMDTFVVDSLQGMMLSYNSSLGEKAVMVRLDETLTPDWMVTMEDSVVNPSFPHSLSTFNDLAFDYDSNLIFLSVSSIRGSFSDTVNFYSIPMVDGTPVYLKNSAAVLVFERTETTPHLRSYGMVPAVNSSACQYMNNMACGNGRIFLQSNFSGGLRIPGNEHIGSTIFTSGSGLTIFDYDGHVIGGTSYYTSSPYSRPGAIALRDSVLYLAVRLSDDNATFGDIPLNGSFYFSTVAKYVDTAFMSPYVFVPSQDTGNVHINSQFSTINSQLSVFPNPSTSKVTIQVQNSKFEIQNCILTDMMGRREEVKLVNTGDGQYSLDMTDRPQAIYLLTMLTADGEKHTVRLIKQ